jgi:hypothetical protein
MFLHPHYRHLDVGGGISSVRKKTTQISPLQSTERRGEHQKMAHTRGENATTATAEGRDRNRSSSPQTEAEPWPPPPSRAEIGNPRRVHASAPRWRLCPALHAAAAAALRQREATGRTYGGVVETS